MQISAFVDGHSDPEKLKQAAVDIQHLSPEELKERQMEIKELMEKLKTPSDAKLMKIAIDDLNNLFLSLEDRHRALQELLILVEPIDNANGFFASWDVFYELDKVSIFNPSDSWSEKLPSGH